MTTKEEAMTCGPDNGIRMARLDQRVGMMLRDSGRNWGPAVEMRVHRTATALGHQAGFPLCTCRSCLNRAQCAAAFLRLP
jgi:hypothetical protein